MSGRMRKDGSSDQTQRTAAVMEEEENIPVRSLRETLGGLPAPISQTGLFDGEQERFTKSLPTLVVLDDDPTGTQTCHGINVLTVWDIPTLVEEFQASKAGFFILTNSRALSTPDARDLIRTVCQAVQAAARIAGKEFEIVLRGDSTLRGHFPDEPQVTEDVIGEVDAWILAPFFFQGGRLTIDDVHYVADGDNLVPAAQTPFAKDATFGYRNSNLVQYVLEKSKGLISSDQIRSISLSTIRCDGPDGVTKLLLHDFSHVKVIIVNAAAETDMEIFVQGLLQANKLGKRYIYRTGAAFVSTRLGIRQIPPISATSLDMDLSNSGPGGLIIAGSYVPKTTTQLKSLVEGRGEKLNTIIMDVKRLLGSPEAAEQVLADTVREASQMIVSGKDVLVMTSRELIVGTDEVSSLNIGGVVAAALVKFLQRLEPRPRYIIAKGGITSSDAATKGLGMKRAQIVGQAASGVPLWRCDEQTSKHRGIPYVVFPGNVGNDDTLLQLVARWSPKSAQEPDLKKAPKMQYQRLGSSGLKVSRIILGCMSYGNPDWEGSPWILDEDKALPLLKKAYDVGINTWDTANTYSNGVSESIIGKALRKYNIPRSRVVIMTKIYYPVMEDEPNARPSPALNDGPLANQMGLSRKHIFEAVEASLQRLGTSYIDVLQIHRLDRETSPEEIMRALHDLVQAGKVMYLGASSMYCWEFARLQYTAKLNGWTPFVSMQGLYNLLYREEEREINPFCEATGVGLIPWSPLARGLLCRPWQEKTDRSEKDVKSKTWFQGPQNAEIVSRVERVAERRGCTMAAVATAWVLHKGACPIVGLGSESRIESVSQAFEITLSDDDLRELEEPYEPLRVQAM